MGGSVQVVVRFTDDSVVARTRWTNSLPSFVRDPRFIACDEAYFREYANTKSGYDGNHGVVAPYGYGLVIFDLQTKTILSRQGYTSFVDMNVFENREAYGFSIFEDLALFDQFLRDGLLSIQLITARRNKGGPISDRKTEKFVAPGDPAEFERFIAPFAYPRLKSDPDTLRHASLVLDISPWTVDQEDWSPGDPVDELRQKVDALGFTQTPESETLWEEARAEAEAGAEGDR